MPDEPMTLIERLRNPQWVHNPTNFVPPALDVDQTRRDMDEAASEIKRLEDLVAIRANSYPIEFVDAAGHPGKLFRRNGVWFFNGAITP